MHTSRSASPVRLAPIAGSPVEKPPVRPPFPKPIPSDVAPRNGMTSLELVIVFSIGIACSLVVVPLAAQLGVDAQAAATRATLRTLRDVVVQRFGQDMKTQAGGPSLPRGTDGRAANLKYLFVSPATTTEEAANWKGPYLHRSAYYPAPTDLGRGNKTAAERGFTSQFAAAGDPTVLDAWGSPIVLQAGDDGRPARLVSAGPNGVLETSDDLVLPLLESSRSTQAGSAE